MRKFPFYRQRDVMDCGPTCLQMISKFHGKEYSLSFLREQCYILKTGVSLLGISEAAETIGLRTKGVKIDFNTLRENFQYPLIIHWNQFHFVVVYKITKSKVYVADPSHGKVKYTFEEFVKGWAGKSLDETHKGVCLFLETTPYFYQNEEDKGEELSLKFLYKYLVPHKKFLFQLVLGLLVGSLLQLIFPFLTQSIIDIGINTQDISFIYLVLIAQLVLFISRMSVEFIRSWILLHISTRINISIISDFLIKLMRLPIKYFDSKLTGDIIQRIEDHSRIEKFLTGQTLSILFSVFNLFLFGGVLAYYNLNIFLIFLVGSVFYFAWITIFLKKRKDLDYKRFAQMSSEQSNLFQLVTGMQEIKLNNCETQKRWEWEQIQAKIFKVNIQGLSLSQTQQVGGLFFNETKNILIAFIAAKSVIEGDMTLGMMLSVQYILGQLNGPVEQMISFLQTAQDAKISLERLAEVHGTPEEDEDYNKISYMPEDNFINISNVTFQYEGPRSPIVLNSVNIKIQRNKVTAIVGASGSGKTTLIKMLLGFYTPVQGRIDVGLVSLNNYNQRWWRSKCGAVMQDGFIFSGTIAENIAMDNEIIDKRKLMYAVKIANIQDFIEGLPMGYNTKIGTEGEGISQGQKQRILIARAVYKDPEYLFFDEATNSLDANNEKVILNNLQEFYKGKTVVVIAHRLSTVYNADQIIVLDKGIVVESGSHTKLVSMGGYYLNLVKNQLELGN